MDVNAIGTNMNSVNVYNNNNDLLQHDSTVINTNYEISEIKQTQESKSNEEKKDEVDKKELDKAVKKLNKFLEDENTHAEYSVHKDLGTLMIKIVDDKDKTILELPPKKILDMVASMCKQVGLIDEKA